MSEEHYPARSVGNEDIVAMDFSKSLNLLMNDSFRDMIDQGIRNGKEMQQISDELFDNELSTSLYPKGRTARTLCRNCNTFLGVYDEAYKKFFDVDGDPKIVKGYHPTTKNRIIKSIYAKFLSVPECKHEDFDFINFIKSDSIEYDGEWKIFCTKRDNSTDLFGLPHIGTGKMTYPEGDIYELSDVKFIYHLMKFEPHEGYRALNIFDITKKKFKIIEGHELIDGGYHSGLMIQQMLPDLFID
ncbi:hypothetical protein [Enterococcus sp. JM9B]|uniref:hypothetical protein n=1 Tax=Enterococcus sp. JM9B TaxID=1857216 RepID=UPI001374D728|nr:hypothetical protein [Enterococcus sp. JM9B]KAF1304203.1 hypothetical protein BAU16_02305 [Enterococcus sp. JM9B]